MMNVYVIGCGGIGGYITDKLPMVISSLCLDYVESMGHSIDPYLRNAGMVALPCIVDRLVLIDGDTFNPRNAIRQGMGAGSKLAQRIASILSVIDEKTEAAKLTSEVLDTCERLKALTAGTALDSAVQELLDDRHVDETYIRRLRSEMVKVSFLQSMQIVGYNKYLAPSNIEDIIPLHPEHRHSAAAELPLVQNNRDKVDHYKRLANTSVVFICVDNIKTRYEVSKYMERFDNCLVINGGNDKVTGHVTVYERSNGVSLDPELDTIYTDLRPDVDLRPDETPCTELSPEHNQIAVTNSTIADIMLARFVQWATKGLTATKKNGSEYRYNDIYIDITTPSMTPLYHPKMLRSNEND